MAGQPGSSNIYTTPQVVLSTSLPILTLTVPSYPQNLVVPAARQYRLEAEYEYLRPSIKQFPTGREQEALAYAAGFSSAEHREIAFGLMGVLIARKAA